MSNILVGVIILACLMVFVVLWLVYLYVTQPIRRTAEWARKMRLGQGPPPFNPTQEKLLGPLADEISHLAKSLERARASAELEARLRLSSEFVWTPERLKEFVRIKLENRPLFVVSNREPYQHVRSGKEVRCLVPPSGLVTALEPILKACGGTWIAQATGDADRETADEQGRLRVPIDEPQYTLKRVWITKEEELGFYNGFSNEGLWPLCHIAHTRPIFREQDWLYYKVVNEKFLAAILEELEPVAEPCILVQDYHFALLPELIRMKRPDARIAVFWHIPWPNPESFGICPWQNELLKGMLGADVVGFHTQFNCNNFIESVDRFLESRIDYETFTVNREKQTTWIKPFPISVAFTDGFDYAPAKTAEPARQDFLRSHGIQAQFIGVGVDRLDYTKGILERFLSIEAFLEKNPRYVGLFSFVELAAPSRTLIPRYQEFEAEVEREVQRINDRFKSAGRNAWKAIHFLKNQHRHAEILPFYRLADFCMVTSLHDGMNLVSKEFVAARDDENGVLILSQFTGASREFHDALIVNPYDISQMAESIRTALDMPAGEQQKRMRRMRNTLREWNIFRWAADVVGELTRIRTEVPAKEEVYT